MSTVASTSPEATPESKRTEKKKRLNLSIIGALTLFVAFMGLIYTAFINPIRQDIREIRQDVKTIDLKIDTVEQRLSDEIDQVRQSVDQLEKTINQRFDDLLIRLIENRIMSRSSFNSLANADWKGNASFQPQWGTCPN